MKKPTTPEEGLLLGYAAELNEKAEEIYGKARKAEYGTDHYFDLLKSAYAVDAEISVVETENETRKAAAKVALAAIDEIDCEAAESGALNAQHTAKEQRWAIQGGIDRYCEYWELAAG